ncbi:MAG: hypothetical protein ACE5H6_04105 [Dehalococcoidia bacterium]
MSPRRRVYTVEAFLRRDLRRWKRMVLRPRASLLAERYAHQPIDRRVDRHVNRHVTHVAKKPRRRG